MKKYKVEMELSERQMHVLNRSLEFYLRMGIGHFSTLLDNPSLEQILELKNTPKRPPIVGDRTNQGEILEIKDGKALINGSVKDGRWNSATEWKILEDVELSTDYELYHKDVNDINNFLSDMFEIHRNGNLGIHNKRVDDSCRVAADLHMVLRNKLYQLSDHDNDWSTYSFAPSYPISTEEDLPIINIVESE